MLLSFLVIVALERILTSFPVPCLRYLGAALESGGFAGDAAAAAAAVFAVKSPPVTVCCACDDDTTDDAVLLLLSPTGSSAGLLTRVLFPCFFTRAIALCLFRLSTKSSADILRRLLALVLLLVGVAGLTYTRFFARARPVLPVLNCTPGRTAACGGAGADTSLVPTVDATGTVDVFSALLCRYHGVASSLENLLLLGFVVTCNLGLGLPVAISMSLDEGTYCAAAVVGATGLLRGAIVVLFVVPLTEAAATEVPVRLWPIACLTGELDTAGAEPLGRELGSGAVLVVIA